MTATLKSAFFAATLSLALAFGMTTGQAIFYPDAAQAGIVGGLKKAASTVGGAVKKGAVTVGSGAKKVGVGVGRNVRDAAIVAARSPVGDAVKYGGKVLHVKDAASGIKKAAVKVGKVVTGRR
jgi:hypothetical protein